MKSLRIISSVALFSAVALQFVTAGSGVGADNSSEKPYPVAATLPLGIRTFLSMETSPNVFNMVYHYGKVTPAANGAYLQNIGASASSWYIEDQRYGSVDVIGGILHRDLSLLETGLKMFDFGLYREAANGSFPGSFGLFHGTAMFLAEAGPAMLVLKYWVREPYLPSSLRSHINWEISRMKQAAIYLVNAWWHKPGHIDDGGKEERKFEGAIGIESVGILSNNTFLQQRAAVYAREGDAMTESNGVWTEHGITSLCCHDSSYQAIGLDYGVDYLALLGSGALYNAVQKSVWLGEQWEISRTSAGGSINRSGDDRTGTTCPERDGSGKCKTVDLAAIFSALMRWGVLSSQNTFVRRAYFVWLNNYQVTTGKKLPAPSMFVYPHNSMTLEHIKYHYPFFVGATRFQPVEPVKVYFGSTLVGQVVADQTGNFGRHSSVSGVKFTPPARTTPGKYKISGQGAYGTYRFTYVYIKK